MTFGGLGGGIFCNSIYTATIENNLIVGNTAGQGGGICCWNRSSPTIVNNTIAENTASYYGGGIVCFAYSSPAIANTVFWSNESPTGEEIWVERASHPIIDYSDVEGGQSSVYLDPDCTLTWGASMIDANPLFIDPASENYRLSQVASGQATNSPCWNTGDPVSAMIVGSTRTDWVQDDGIVDMGYHYAIPTASATFRNAGTNPASYDVVALPVLGSTFSGTIDLGGTTGHGLAWLVGFRSPLSMVLGGGQVLLVDIGAPWGELFQLPIVPGPLATFDLDIPADPVWAGFECSSQALHVGGVQPFALSNARDLVLGF